MLTLNEFIIYIVLAIVLYLVWFVIIYPYYLVLYCPIPGPPRNSIIFGHLPEILKEEPQVPNLRWSKIYTGPIFKLFAGPAMRVVPNDAEVVKQVLSDEKTFTKNLWDYEIIAEITGYSFLITSDIDFHRRQRHLCNSSFKYENIINFIPIFNYQANKLISKWKDIIKINSNNDNESLIEVTNDLSALTLDIIGIGGFNCDFDSLLNTGGNELCSSYTKLIDTYKPSLWMIVPGFKWLPFPIKLTRRKYYEYINKTVNQIISQRRKEKINVTDLLGTILEAKDEKTGESLSDQEIRDICLTFLSAGHETTGNLLVWSLYIFAKYPEIEKKCREEVISKIGSNPLSAENIGELKYLSNTLNEILRLHAPIPLIKRYTEKDTILGGYTVPKGTHIVISIPVLHRSPKHWEDPDEFKPERWDNKVNHSYWFLPFSEGHRNCIGKKFAQTEAMTVLVGILQNFSFRISDAHPFIKKQMVTVKPVPGLTLHVKSL